MVWGLRERNRTGSSSCPELRYGSPVELRRHANLCLIRSMGSPVRGTRIVDLRRRAERLRESGRSRRGVAFAGALLAARVLRAKRLRQTPSYGYAWVVSFIVGILPFDPPLDLDILLVSCGRSDMHPASEASTFAELVFYLAFGIVLLIIGAIYAARRWSHSGATTRTQPNQQGLPLRLRSRLASDLIERFVPTPAKRAPKGMDWVLRNRPTKQSDPCRTPVPPFVLRASQRKRSS